MSNNKEERFFTGFTYGALTGAIIGAVAAIMLAPRSGEETREKLTAAVENYKSKTKDVYDKVTTKAKEEADRAIDDADVIRRYARLSPEAKTEFKRQLANMLGKSDAEAVEQALSELEYDNE